MPGFASAREIHTFSSTIYPTEVSQFDSNEPAAGLGHKAADDTGNLLDC